MLIINCQWIKVGIHEPSESGTMPTGQLFPRYAAGQAHESINFACPQFQLCAVRGPRYPVSTDRCPTIRSIRINLSVYWSLNEGQQGSYYGQIQLQPQAVYQGDSQGQGDFQGRPILPIYESENAIEVISNQDANEGKGETIAKWPI